MHDVCETCGGLIQLVTFVVIRKIQTKSKNSGTDLCGSTYEAGLFSVLVGEELVIDEVEAEGVSDVEDGGFGRRRGRGVGDVAPFAIEGFFVARRGPVLMGGALEAVGAGHGG